MPKPSISYNRTPSDELIQLLKPGRFLSPLISLNKRDYNGLKLDVHFRLGDEVHVYYGLTRIITVKRLKRPDGCIKFDAAEKYKGEPRAKEIGLFRRWIDGEQGLSEAIEAYLKAVEVNENFTEKEGCVQSQWSEVTDLWTPFDREAVPNYESTQQRVEAKQFDEVDMAWNKFREINEVDKNQLGAPPELKSKSIRKPDQIAVDPQGRLVIIELKDVSSGDAKSVYYSPFQLLRYVWEWHNALQDKAAMLADLQQLIDARKQLGMTPQDVPDLNGSIRAAVGFGTPMSGSARKFQRLSDRFDKYKRVLNIVNQCLPPDVPPIETWAFKNGKPCEVKLD